MFLSQLIHFDSTKRVVRKLLRWIQRYITVQYNAIDISIPFFSNYQREIVL